MADLNDLIEDSNAKLSRRNVVVGTAWAVPTIMAVGAAPAMAASGATAAATVKIEGSKLKVSITAIKPGETDSVIINSVASGSETVQWNKDPVSTPFSPNPAVFDLNVKKNAPVTNASCTIIFTVSNVKGAPKAYTGTFTWADGAQTITLL